MDAYQLAVICPVDPDENFGAGIFRDEFYARPFAKMLEQRMAFMDTLVLSLTERAPEVECFVTWNAKHFRGKSLPVLTPEEYLLRE